MKATGDAAATPVFVEAPARLHFGVLDLRGDLGRRFGGIGAAVPAPSLLLEAARASTLRVEGPDRERALEFARRFLAHHAIAGGAHLRLHRIIPPHAGLGSGTQLGLAVARALAELHGLPTEVAALARAVGRGRRSAIGTWTFALGGFVLEGGRRDDAEHLAPLLAHLPLPTAWRCVIAVPRGAPGLSGEEEAAAFARLPPPERREVERVAHLVLMQLLPALADADLPSFGAALAEVQRLTGGWFAAVQGAPFAPGESAALVQRLRDWGAVGVGQSSWGPAAYGLAPDEGAARELADRARSVIGPGGVVYEGGFSATGARVTREVPG
ncbi:MAG: beta-ribofuranosylaminobenzene 5'-phosphate synthase family protein [Gemmatimonadales bacterium]